MSDRGQRPEGARPPPGGAGRGPRPGGVDPDQQKLLGVLLVGLAVLVGVVLLVRGFGDEDGLVAPAPETATTEPDEESRDAPPTTEPAENDTTTTTASPENGPSPGEVTVLVANAGGPSGAAGTTTEQLADDGFETLPATNATDQVASTQVQYGEDSQPAAELVASSLGLGSDAVAPLGDPPAVADLGAAQVLVLVGPEDADGQPAEGEEGGGQDQGG